MAEGSARGPKMSVRVRPDTTKFAADLKAKLTAVEKAQGPMRVKVHADLTGLEKIKPVVKIDTDAIRKSIEGTLKNASTIRFKAEIDEASFKAMAVNLQSQIERVQAELKKLKQQSEEARYTQAEARESSSTIVVDADTTAAEAQMALAARNRSSTVNLHANVSKATAEIKGMLAGMSGARVAGDAIKSVGTALSQLDRTVPKLGGVSIGVGGIGGAALSSVGSVLTLGSSLGALAGAAGPLPAVVASLAAMGGTLIAAFGGVGDALTETSAVSGEKAATEAKNGAAGIKSAYDQVGRAQEDAVAGAASAARSMRNAREAMASVQKSTAEATKGAAEAVANATKGEAKAHRDTATAQKDLTQARKDAIRELKDLDSQLKNASLDSRELEQNLVDAKQAYAEAQTDDTRGQGALDALKLQADRAAQAVSDNQNKIKNLSADKSKADKVGINGSEGVLKAEQSLADARERQAEAIKDSRVAQENVVATELANTLAIRGAREGLADAQEAQTKQARDSARAQVDAAAALVAAQAVAATSATKANEAMSDLTPSAREAVTALSAVRTQLGEVQDIAQEAFFKGFAAPLTALAAVVMPQLKTGIGELAGVMGDGFEAAMNGMSESFGGGVLENMFSKTAEGATAFNEALAPAINSIATLGTVGVDYLPRMGTAIADAAKQFDGFLSKAAADGSMNQWIEDGITAFKDLGSVLGSSVSILGSISQAASAAGGGTLATLADGMDKLATKMTQEPFQSTMTTIFRGANAAMDGVGVALGHIGDLMVAIAPTLEVVMGKAGEAIAVIAEGIGGALSDPAFGEGLIAFFDGLLIGLDALLPVMPMVGQLLGMTLQVAGELAAALGPVLAVALEVLIPVLNVVLEALMPIIEMLGTLLVTAINILAPYIEVAGNHFKNLGKVIEVIVLAVQKLLEGDLLDFFALLSAAVMLAVLRVGEALFDLVKTFAVNNLSLTQSGRDLIGGWVDGIKDGFAAAARAVQEGMAWLRGFFPNSPAQRGPFSGAGWTKLKTSGGAVTDQFAAGLSESNSVDRAAEDLMRSAGLTGSLTVKGQAGSSSSAGATSLGSTFIVNESTNAHSTAIEIMRLQGAGV